MHGIFYFYQNRWRVILALSDISYRLGFQPTKKYLVGIFCDYTTIITENSYWKCHLTTQRQSWYTEWWNHSVLGVAVSLWRFWDESVIRLAQCWRLASTLNQFAINLSVAFYPATTLLCSDLFVCEIVLDFLLLKYWFWSENGCVKFWRIYFIINILHYIILIGLCRPSIRYPLSTR